SGRAFSCPAGPIKKFGCGLRGGFGAQAVERLDASGVDLHDRPDTTARFAEIPTIRIGRLIRVPVRALEKMLDQAGVRASPLRKRRRGTRRNSAYQPRGRSGSALRC